MKKYLFPLILIALTTLFAACSSDDGFTPGPAVTEGNPGVFFYGDYDAMYVVASPTPEDTLWFELGRIDTTEAIDVPIVLESSSVLGYPESVHFDAGDSTAWMGITYDKIAYGQETPIRVRIADEYCNPYSQKDNGSTRLVSSILMSKWIPVSDTITFAFTNDKIVPDQHCNVENLEGTSRFRFTDFVGSGKSLEFTLTGTFDGKDLRNNYGEITPVSNYYDGGSYWYFTNGGNYDSWTPVNATKTIKYMYIWKGSSYTFLDFRCDEATADSIKLGGKTYLYDMNHYGLLCSYITYTDGTAGWDYIYVYTNYLKKE